jgi:bifunctional DNase/RNase
MENILPIWIGPLEASSILLELEHVTPPRPMTHDLFVKFIRDNNIRIKKVVITELNNNTYFSKIHYRVGLKSKIMDARPSDAISLALRTKASLLVNKQVIESTLKLNSKSDSKNSPDYYKQLLEKLDKKDMGDTVM